MKDMDSSLLVIAVVALSVALFAAYNYKTRMADAPLDNWQEQPQWQEHNWINQPRPETNVEPPSRKQSPPQMMSYEQALQQARRDNKQILVIFDQQGCTYCEKMKSETLSDPRVKSAMSKYILAGVDKNAEPNVARRLNVGGTPSYRIITSTQRTVKSGDGFKNVDDFLNWLSDPEQDGPGIRRDENRRDNNDRQPFQQPRRQPQGPM